MALKLILDDSTSVFIEETHVGGTVQPLSSPGSVIQEHLDEVLSPLKKSCQRISENLQECGPDEIAVEFEIGVTAEAGVIITKAQTSGTLKVSLKWKKGSPT